MEQEQSCSTPADPSGLGRFLNGRLRLRGHAYMQVFLSSLISRITMIFENADARPPHLVFVVRLGSSGEMLCFGSNLGCFGSGRGSNGRGAPVGSICTEFQLKRSHGDPFHAQNNRLCATGSNSGAPGSQEISPLTSRTALEQRSVSWGSHLSGFCFEQSHGDLFRDQNVPILSYGRFFFLLS